MLQATYTTRFEKDITLDKKRRKDMEKLKKIIVALLKEESLPDKYRDHWLKGNYVNRRECHIEPDWLLIYKPMDDRIIFERTGTHSDLFK